MREKILDFCREAADLLTTAYLFILFVIYPLYMQHGYDEIGESKFFFYRDISIGGFALIAPFALILFVHQIAKKELKIYITDYFVLAYAVVVAISYGFCMDRHAALWGEYGWNMGLVTQMSFVIAYFYCSRLVEYSNRFLYFMLTGSVMVFVMGILNRFSVFPFHVFITDNTSFISTLGNINWYCGFLVIFLGIGAALYWCTDMKWLRILCGFYMLIAFGTGVSQGSNSVWISIGAVMLILFCMSFADIERMYRFLELCIIFCASCQLLRLIRIIPARDPFTYYLGSLSDYMTMTRWTLVLMLGFGGLYVLLQLGHRKGVIYREKLKWIRQTMMVIAVLMLGTYLLVTLINSHVEDGIRGLGQIEALSYSERWGSARGGTWKAGVDAFKTMTPGKKLIGVGPDTFANYIYTFEDLTKRLNKQFDFQRLTNPHNEMLSILVNYGILGAISYLGIFVSSIATGFYAWYKSNRCPHAWILGVAVISYFLHNIVSFQQILSTPFVFCILGLMQAALYHMGIDKENDLP